MYPKKTDASIYHCTKVILSTSIGDGLKDVVLLCPLAGLLGGLASVGLKHKVDLLIGILGQGTIDSMIML